MLRLQWNNFIYLGERHACVLKVFMALVQVYLVVRSFADAEAYLHTNWYARVANREYPSDVSATETDFESHFTVACYDADPAVSGAQVKKVPSSISISAPKLPTVPSCDAHLFLNSIPGACKRACMCYGTCHAWLACIGLHAWCSGSEANF